MDIITQVAYHRQRMVSYSLKHGVAATAIRYRTSQKTVYKWLSRYDGSIESLRDQSRRPHSHPRRHTAKEEEMIRRVAGRCDKKDKLLMYDEYSTHSARDFLEKLVKAAPFPIRLVQTDNGTEFTNALLVIKSKHKTLFEQALFDMGIEYKRIRIATPQHNGKVERRHRTDEQRFYKHMRMFSLTDGRKQLAAYQRRSNHHIMTCLNFKSPIQVLELYLHLF